MEKIFKNRLLMLGIIFVILSISYVIAGNTIFKENSDGGVTITVDDVESNNGYIDFNGNNLNNTGAVCDDDDCYNPDFTKNVSDGKVTLRVDI